MDVKKLIEEGAQAVQRVHDPDEQLKGGDANERSSNNARHATSPGVTAGASEIDEMCKELESPVDERTIGPTTETRKFYDRLHLKAAALIRRLVAERDEARIELGNAGEDYREQQAKLRNTFADAQSMKARATAAEAEVERIRAALERIYREGDGWNEHRPEEGKYAGTTGEGHARCREIASAALEGKSDG